MSDLVQFLTARLDEDAVVARDHIARQIDAWAYANGPETDQDYSPTGHYRPQRVLADADAKRAILALHGHGWREPVPSFATLACVTCSEHGYDDSYGELSREGNPWPCRTLRLLALPYYDHPDFDPTWAS